jgi:uncharacterized protein YPO0396
VQNDLPLLVRDRDSPDRFWLAEIQLNNWGTFSHVHKFPIARRGYCFAGPSGAGKSTALDAHATLLTPPKNRTFNVAARGEGGRDRNLMTYVRGAWGSITDTASFETAKRYLREDSTWSAIAETYRNAKGQAVTLAQVFWVRGRDTDTRNLNQRFFIFEREFDITAFEGFCRSEFNKRYVDQTWPDAHYRDDFKSYQEIFSRLLGLPGNDNALRLLHKTQSTKDLGDLNAFLREFMLDEPQTFVVRDALVNQFGELNQAHESVIDAERQIAILQPARGAYESHRAGLERTAWLNALQELREPFFERQRRNLLEEALLQVKREIADAEADWQEASAAVQAADALLGSKKDQLNRMGGSRIESLEREQEQAQELVPGRESKAKKFEQACLALGWPEGRHSGNFVKAQEDAKQFLASMGEDADKRRDQEHALVLKRGDLEREITGKRREIEAMERQSSNIDAHLLEIRDRLCRELKLDAKRLPFAGELLEVKAEEARWRGPLERVLHGFGLSMLVFEADMDRVSDWMDAHNLRGRLVYIKVAQQTSAGQQVSPRSLLHKLEFAKGPHRDWLYEEIKAFHNFECCETADELRHHRGRGVTLAGQVRHNSTRFEKDDRRRIDDASNWILGFGNTEKLALYKRQVQDLSEKFVEIAKELSSLAGKAKSANEQARQCQTLIDLSWQDIDIDSLMQKIRALDAQLKEERDQNPDLDRLSGEIKAKTVELERLREAAAKKLAAVQGYMNDQEKYKKQAENLDAELLAVEIPEAELAELQERQRSVKRAAWSETDDASTRLERHRDVLHGVKDQIQKDLSTLSTERAQLEIQMVGTFRTYIERWRPQSDGLDAVMASAEDFMTRLAKLEEDNLPAFKEKFANLLHEQSNQNLTRLSSRLDQERRAIADRIEQCNAALLLTDYNPGSYLQIKPHDLQQTSVNEFKRELKTVLEMSMASGSRETDEARFKIIKGLVNRLSSDKPEDRSWQATVLDVRRHIEFIAFEMGRDGVQRESYRGATGKSGGQGQKLTLTVLAAALRYQLGGEDGDFPQFNTVTMDEAFDKTDTEFTRMTMKIFEACGFQMVVATPLKAVMVLDQFIGGACFVHMQGQHQSKRLLIEYDEEAQQLKLDESLRRQAQAEFDQERAEQAIANVDAV